MPRYIFIAAVGWNFECWMFADYSGTIQGQACVQNFHTLEIDLQTWEIGQLLGGN